MLAMANENKEIRLGLGVDEASFRRGMGLVKEMTSALDRLSQSQRTMAAITAVGSTVGRNDPQILGGAVSSLAAGRAMGPALPQGAGQGLMGGLV